MENTDIQDVEETQKSPPLGDIPNDPSKDGSIGFDVPKSETRTIEPANRGVALALGGGAARGWAHIGVLRAFDEAGIPVSMIAGTSIGALVGGCYLAGKLDELEEFARSITRTGILRYMDFTFRGSGLISGGRLASKMDAQIGHLRIEELERRFVAVATDIQSGHEIWLHDGSLGKAIQASYALPGVFKPVMYAGRNLVDGALVNPVPVSACRAYEAEVVVAVNLNSETFGRGTVVRSKSLANQDLPAGLEENLETPASWLPFKRGSKPTESDMHSRLGVTGVMIEAFNIIQDRITRSRLAGDPPDYTIRPRLKDIGLTDFYKADEAIRLGYEEGKNRIAELEDVNQLAAM